MDYAAKQTSANNPEESPYSYTFGEPWYFTINGQKVWKKKVETICKEVHGKRAIQYWI